MTPSRRTSSGRREMVAFTRFCTSTCAWSRSAPRRKVTVICTFPSLVDEEDRYNIFSTPLISCSRGVETVSASVRASAPGYVAETTTVGGMTSGYCAMGSET